MRTSAERGRRIAGARWFTIGLVALALSSSACQSKGPAQEVGEKVDRAADKISDTVHPKGPVEKAGRAIDRATGN